MPRIEISAPVTVLLFLAATATTVLEIMNIPANRLFAASGRFEPLDPMIWLGWLTWPVPHGSLDHLIGNFAVLLLVGPLLENRLGSWTTLALYALTAVVIGAANAFLFDHGLIGASGLVFMAIMLVSVSSGRAGMIPLSFLLIAALYLGREVLALLSPDTTSQFAHLFGGAIGILVGLMTKQPAVGTGSRTTFA